MGSKLSPLVEMGSRLSTSVEVWSKLSTPVRVIPNLLAGMGVATTAVLTRRRAAMAVDKRILWCNGTRREDLCRSEERIGFDEVQT